MKRSLLSIGGALLLSAPLVATVACGDPADGTEDGTWLPSDKIKDRDTLLTSATTLKNGVTATADYWFVTDEGSVEDKSFNQSGFDGVYTGAKANSKTYNYAQSKDLGGIKQGYDAAKSGGAKIVVGAGFQHGSIAPEAFAKTGDVAFVGIDASYRVDNTKSTDFAKLENLVSINYNSQYAGFAAGLFAISQIEKFKDKFEADENGDYHVAAYGGMPFPTVKNWLDGFQYAIDSYGDKGNHGKNEDTLTTGTDGTINVKMVYVKGTAPSESDFSGGFGITDENNGKATQAKNITKNYLDKGADIIFPVAGPQIQLSIEEIKIKQSSAKVIGVDADQAVALAPSFRNFVIGSALKLVKEDAIEALKKFETRTKAGADNKWNDIKGKNILGQQGFVDYNGVAFKAGLTNFEAIEKLYEDKIATTPASDGYNKIGQFGNWAKIVEDDISW